MTHKYTCSGGSMISRRGGGCQPRLPIVALSGQQTLVELHASRTNEDVRMYT